MLEFLNGPYLFAVLATCSPVAYFQAFLLFNDIHLYRHLRHFFQLENPNTRNEIKGMYTLPTIKQLVENRSCCSSTVRVVKKARLIKAARAQSTLRSGYH